MELEKQLEQLDKEYEEGELTKKGWKKRSLVIKKKILKSELEDGDLTEKGYHKKVVQIDKELEELLQARPADVPSTADAADISESLASCSEMENTIKHLFHFQTPRSRKRKSSSATSAATRTASASTKTASASTKTASASTKTASASTKTASASTKSASATKRLSSTLAESSTTTPMAKKLKLLNPKPTKLVNPKPCIPEKQSFLEQLYDKCLFRMYQEESICYVPDREDDETDTDVNMLEPGELFLCINSTVETWIESRKERGLSIPRKHLNFYLPTEECMSDFDGFRESFKKVGQPNEAVLRPTLILKTWMKEEKVSHRAVVFQGNEYYAVPRIEIDSMIEWIKEARNLYPCPVRNSANLL